MRKIQNILHAGVIISALSHVFCCGLPTAMSILSLMTSFGVFSVAFETSAHWHEMMHEWETPMLVASAAMVVLGWGLYFYARKLDCATSCCSHEPCAPKKSRNSVMLWIATALFVVNAVILLSH